MLFLASNGYFPYIQLFFIFDRIVEILVFIIPINIYIAHVIDSQDHHEGTLELFSENIYPETFCSNFDDLCVMESTILTRKK